MAHNSALERKEIDVKRGLNLIFATAVLLAIGAGVAAFFVTPAEAGRCVCPKIYAPVECNKGKVYPNQCVADCRRAKNCVPVSL